jgi:hypothetical protein
MLAGMPVTAKRASASHFIGRRSGETLVRVAVRVGGQGWVRVRARARARARVRVRVRVRVGVRLGLGLGSAETFSKASTNEVLPINSASSSETACEGEG